MSISQKIKAIRAAENLSQTQFAKKYEIPLKSLQNWEQGEREPPAYVVKFLEIIHETENKKTADD